MKTVILFGYYDVNITASSVKTSLVISDNIVLSEKRCIIKTLRFSHSVEGLTNTEKFDIVDNYCEVQIIDRLNVPAVVDIGGGMEGSWYDNHLIIKSGDNINIDIPLSASKELIVNGHVTVSNNGLVADYRIKCSLTIQYEEII